MLFFERLVLIGLRASQKGCYIHATRHGPVVVGIEHDGKTTRGGALAAYIRWMDDHGSDLRLTWGGRHQLHSWHQPVYCDGQMAVP